MQNISTKLLLMNHLKHLAIADFVRRLNVVAHICWIALEIKVMIYKNLHFITARELLVAKLV